MRTYVDSTTVGFELMEFTASSYTSLYQVPPGVYKNGDEEIKVLVRFVGNTITVYVNDDYIFSVTDSTHTTGRCGMRNGTNDNPEIKDFSVYSLPANWEASWDGGQLASAIPGNVTRYSNQGGSDVSPTVAPGQTLTMTTRTLNLEEPKLVYVTASCDVKFPNSNSKAGHIWVELDDNGVQNGAARWHTHGQESGSDNLTSTAIFYVPAGSHDIDFKIDSDGGSSNNAVASRYVMDTFVVDPYNVEIPRQLTGSTITSSYKKTQNDGGTDHVVVSTPGADKVFDELLTISAEVGDVIEVSANAMWVNEAAGGNATYAVIANGTVVRRGGGSSGLAAWYTGGSRYDNITGSVLHTVQADEVVNGQVSFRLDAWSAGVKRIYCDAAFPVEFLVKNTSKAIIDGVDNETGPIQLWEPDAPPRYPHEYDVEWRGATSLPDGWQEFDQASKLDLSFSNLGLTLKPTGATEGSYAVSGVVRPIPAGNFTMITKVNISFKNVDYSQIGIGLLEANSSTGDLSVMRIRNGALDDGLSLAILAQYSSYTTQSSSPVTENMARTGMWYLRMRYISGVAFFDVSNNGSAWFEVGSLSPGYTPTLVGMFDMSDEPDVHATFEFTRFSSATNFDNAIGRTIAVNSGSSSENSYSIIPSWKGFDIDAPKAVADMVDDEFSSSTLANKWSVVNGSAGTVDRFATSGTGSYDLISDPGKLLIQGAFSDDVVWLRQDYTLPDGKSLIMKFHPSVYHDESAAYGTANNEANLFLGLNSDSTDLRAGNYVSIRFDSRDGASRIVSTNDTGGGDVNSGENSDNTALVDSTMYFRIDRIGLTYYMWYSTDGVAWSGTGSATLGAAASRVWIYNESLVDPSTIVPIWSIDWIRQGNTSHIPWTTQPDAGVTIQGTSIRDRLWLPDQDNPLGLDDEFNDDALDSSWSVIDSGTDSLSVNESAGVLSIKKNGVGAAAYRWQGVMKPLGTQTFPMYIETAQRTYAWANNGSALPMVGIGFSDSGTYGSGGMVATTTYLTSGNLNQVHLRRFNNFNTYVGQQFDEQSRLSGSVLFMRLIWESANTWRAQFSPDGINWSDAGKSGWSSTLTPTHMGILISGYGIAATRHQITAFEYFRVRNGLPA